MKRLIIDTGRVQDRWDQTANAWRARQRVLERRDPDALPEKAGDRHRLRGGCKWPGDRVQPLLRWLEKQVGRRWDDVWSEVCAGNDARSIDGWHLRQHVEMAVELPWTPWWYRRGPGSLYVDERGVLRQHPHRRLRWRERWHRYDTPPPPDPDRVEVDERVRYERIEGAWYAVELDPRPELSVWDPGASRRVRRPLPADDPRRWRKRRLSARDVARLRLEAERARRLRLWAERE
jgi:hypothetical protein